MQHKALVTFLLGFVLQTSESQPKKSKDEDVMKKCKFLRMGNSFLLIDERKDLFENDTINLIDVGSISRNCIGGNNSAFFQKKYNFFKEFKGQEPYYHENKKDSIIAWLDLRIFVFDGYIKYRNFRNSPTTSEHYFHLKIQDRMFVFRRFTYVDTFEIWLRKNKSYVLFENCYFPNHSMLE